MTLVEWIVSLLALAWLIAIAVFDIRKRVLPSPLWTGIPLILAAGYRLLAGSREMIVAAAAIAVLLSERRNLKRKPMEIAVLAGGLVILGWMMIRADLGIVSGIVGILVFWISWELHFIGGADAMALITCLMIWPGLEFITAYLVAGLGWSFGVRLKESGWLKGHPVPGLAIVATAAVLYLGYGLFFP
jgi:hypothetical protein